MFGISMPERATDGGMVIVIGSPFNALLQDLAFVLRLGRYPANDRKEAWPEPRREVGCGC